MTTGFGIGALLDDLRPMLVDMAQEILSAAMLQTPAPRFLGATVVDTKRSAGTVTVTPDTNLTTNIVVQSLVGLPATGARVMLMFTPPMGVFIVGYLGPDPRPARVGGKWRRLAVQNVNNVTVTPVIWDTEDQDSDQFGVIGTAAITIPAGCDGRYVVGGDAFFAAVTGGARCFMQLTCSSYTDAPRCSIQGAGESAGGMATVFDMAAGNTLTLDVFQSNGLAVNLARARLEIQRIP